VWRSPLQADFAAARRGTQISRRRASMRRRPAADCATLTHYERSEDPSVRTVSPARAGVLRTVGGVGDEIHENCARFRRRDPVRVLIIKGSSRWSSQGASKL